VSFLFWAYCSVGNVEAGRAEPRTIELVAGQVKQSVKLMTPSEATHDTVVTSSMRFSQV